MVSDAADVIRSVFLRRPEGIAAVYLFGSVARRTATPTSDVDLAVLYRDAPPRTYAALPLDTEGELEKVLGRPVDLVTLNGAPVDLVHRVLRDGMLLLDLDRAVRIRFEVAARNEYFDLLPTLERYRRLRSAPT
jgi:predicted nucleotidyltransferase